MANRLVTREGARTAAQAMRASRAALDRPLEGDAELSVVTITTPATVLGAFQRPQGIPRDLPLLRRASGGPFVRVGPGTLHVVLSLAHPSALVPCDAAHIVNRHVRPLLRALTKSGALAHYFGGTGSASGAGRWGRSASRTTAGRGGRRSRRSSRSASTSRRPDALRSSERSPRRSRRQRGARLTGRHSVAHRGGLRDGRGARHQPAGVGGIGDEGDAVAEEPPWRVTAEEAIGTVGAGPDATGTLRLGGDLMASRSMIERVATCVAALRRGPAPTESGPSSTVSSRRPGPRSRGFATFAAFETSSPGRGNRPSTPKHRRRHRTVTKDL